jgi:hypothetical protein
VPWKLAPTGLFSKEYGGSRPSETYRFMFDWIVFVFIRSSSDALTDRSLVETGLDYCIIQQHIVEHILHSKADWFKVPPLI